MANNEEVVLTVTSGYMNFKSLPILYIKLKEIKNVLKTGFRFCEIVKLTETTDSSIFNINICFYLKLSILVTYTQFFRIFPQTPQSLCIDRNNLFLHAKNG